MKKILPLTVLSFFSFFLFAQNPNKTTLRGALIDSTGTELAFATVMLLEPKDSALINFTRSDEKAAFEFKNIKNRDYLLKISYVGFLPYQSFVSASTKEINDFGKITLKPITKELMEVVIKTARAPLSIKGDTIEYNASSFKVPPGSTVEDLLRRLPGIDVDADGNIKAQGKNIKRLYVDGKTFFGDDPKAATKNLDAEMISKVQVFNEKSDQAKLTGVDDGKKEKAMNLELKDQFKKGAFGKVNVGVGTEDRWATRGNYNRFNKTAQFSVLGYGNNVNQTGVNWEDYGEFKGQNSFNNNDNGDFGFSSGGGFIRYFNNTDVPLNNFDGRGFTNNGGAGTNYNFDNKKTKISTSYFFNQTQLNLNQFGFQKTFLKDSTYSNTDTFSQTDFRRNHSFAIRLEQQIDSNNTLIAKVNLKRSDDDVNSKQGQTYSTNLLQSNRIEGLANNSLNSVAIYRHKFKTKGRSLAASAALNYNARTDIQNWTTQNKFLSNSEENSVLQYNTNENTMSQLKSSVIYTTPLSKKFFSEAFYNFSTTSSQYNRLATNPLSSGPPRIDSLSNYYDNKVLYNRVGTSARYNYEGVNISVGAAYMLLDINGKYAVEKNVPITLPAIVRNYNYFTPNISVELELKNNKYFSLGYSYDIHEPDVKKLQPVTTINSQLYRSIGNPNLEPERSNSFNFNFNMFNPANFSHAGIGADLYFYDNQNVENLTVENIPNLGIRTTSKQENYSGGFRLNGYSWFGFPIIKTKLSFNGNANFNFSKNPSLVNTVLNETSNNTVSFNANLSLTLGTKLILEAGDGIDLTNIDYSINAAQNQKIFNNRATTTVKWNFVKGFYLESNFNYKTYLNSRYGFDQTVPIWNASIRTLLLKDNKLEFRLSAFDIFNKNVNIQQYGSANYYSSSFAPTLSRYFMLGFSYNLRGNDGKLKKNGMMTM